MPIHISYLNGTLDGELAKSPQTLKSIGYHHHKKYKAFKWHKLNAKGSLMVSKSEININKWCSVNTVVNCSYV